MIRHVIVPLYLSACLLLGGASAAGFGANFLLQIAAVPLIGWALWQLASGRPATSARIPLVLLALLVLLLVLELIPLPPAIWMQLPGRGFVEDGYRLLGISLPWLPLALAPDRALGGLLWLMPAIATFLAMVLLGAFRARFLAGFIVGIALVSVALGGLQVIGGGSAYLYEITNYGQAVGFFANSNHNASLLLVSIPFLGAIYANLLERRSSAHSRSAIRLMVVAGYAIIIVGLVINSSLAGIGLCLPVAMASWIALSHQRRATERGIVVAALVVSLIAVTVIAVGPFGNNLFGAQTVNAELSRQTSFALTWQAALDFFPVGSGTGSFRQIYPRYEPLESVGTTYINHAHNDWLEMLLETGVAGVALAALFLFWWCRRARTIWTSEEPDHFGRAAIIATAALMLHSIVDYPLRTAAMSSVFAACMGLMSGVRPYVRARKEITAARHLEI